MYVQVRMTNTEKSVIIPTSRAASVKSFKKLVEEQFKIKPSEQRLFYAGKQLNDGNTLFNYGININDVIQLMVSPAIENSSPANTSNKDDFSDLLDESKYFQTGDYIDVKVESSAWYIGKIIKIKKRKSTEEKSNVPVENDGLVYVVEILRSEDPPFDARLQDLRPFSSEIFPLCELQCGDKVLANYNAEYPKEKGNWYDALIKNIKTTRKGGFDVTADVSIGTEVLPNCKLMFLDCIYKIKPLQLIADRTPQIDEIMKTEPAAFRFDALYCITCKDSMKTCKDCGCTICYGTHKEEELLMCNECNDPYHMACLSPPIKKLPSDDWYCPSCKNDENEIVKAGEKLKVPKIKNLKSSSSKRDWGKGMACVGRTKKCNIVPSNHFGPVPGVDVGTSWKFRMQVSEAGIHRPPVGGIHGRDHEGAYSIILSGGYEDDLDKGDEFIYTGSGGRDLKGNRRSAFQTHDQALVTYNKALALNCDAEIDIENGATAIDWKKGKPVRVVRNYKLGKHSKYAPDEGNRYDGIYKIVRYYPETGRSGFKVWRFVLRRDDPTPAPWTLQGKNHIAQLGLKTIYPENYVQFIENKKKKRMLEDTEAKNNQECTEDKASSPEDIDNNLKSQKKLKLQYTLEKQVEQLIDGDLINKKYWDDCKEFLVKGKKAFLDRVEETFLCICCQEIVFEPITTKCSHNICKECLKRSFNADVFQCPSCRVELGKAYPIDINEKLAEVLLHFFPGYNLER